MRQQKRYGYRLFKAGWAVCDAHHHQAKADEFSKPRITARYHKDEGIGLAKELSKLKFSLCATKGTANYIRKFVGPKAIVSSASGTSLVVDHTKIFRVGYKIIFGTGSNRNVRTITAINNTTNTLTLNSSISGTISSGTEVYETGLDKNFKMASSNIPKISTLSQKGINVKDLITFDKIFIEQKSINEIAKRLS